MEIDKIVADLKKERDRLVRAITALVGAGAATGAKRGRKPGRKAATTKRKRRGGISKEGRKRLSELMKKRWAERRKKGMTKLGK
ncbi:MAG TPA: hypothetical protein VJX68_06190 [Candidatus Binatus sp.]|uniref:hypothetical protein n=1 Tax=Candidatus Binatus sp. TaxID=2811406 RepID=UPI002B471C3D|nr:hypothetical protein [Candidatus Binatus sp.]HKN12770.1 hypothetical protein [Candidatus Binatus sp.]